MSRSEDCVTCLDPVACQHEEEIVTKVAASLVEPYNAPGQRQDQLRVRMEA